MAADGIGRRNRTCKALRDTVELCRCVRERVISRRTAGFSRGETFGRAFEALGDKLPQPVPTIVNLEVMS